MKLGTFLRISDIKDAQSKFDNLKNSGFEACQLVYKPDIYKKEDAEIIKSAAQNSGIDISAMFCGYNDTDTIWDNYYGFMTAGLGVEAYRKSRIEYVKSAIEFANDVGIEDVIIHGGYIPNNPFSAEYAPLLASINTLCKHCKKFGMNLLLETGAESSVALLRVIEDTGADNLFINLDPANMLMYGYANPVDALYTIGKYVRNIHGKDGLPPTSAKFLGKETAVGEGKVDFYNMFKELKKLGYNRYIIIEREIFDNDEKQNEDIMKAKSFFEKLLKELEF